MGNQGRPLSINAWAEAETALIIGESTYSVSPTLEGPLDIQALGSIGRIGVKNDDLNSLPRLATPRMRTPLTEIPMALVRSKFSRRYTDVQSRNGGHTAVAAANVLDPSYRAAPRGL